MITRLSRPTIQIGCSPSGPLAYVSTANASVPGRFCPDGPVKDTTYSLAFSYLGTGMVDTLYAGDYGEMELSESFRAMRSINTK